MQIVAYPAKRYNRSKAVSTEACEFKYFRVTNPALDEAINAIENPPWRGDNSVMGAMPSVVDNGEHQGTPTRQMHSGSRTGTYVSQTCFRQHQSSLVFCSKSSTLTRSTTTILLMSRRMKTTGAHDENARRRRKRLDRRVDQRGGMHRRARRPLLPLLQQLTCRSSLLLPATAVRPLQATATRTEVSSVNVSCYQLSYLHT